MDRWQSLAYCTGLENQSGEIHRGFESLSIRGTSCIPIVILAGDLLIEAGMNNIIPVLFFLFFRSDIMPASVQAVKDYPENLNTGNLVKLPLGASSNNYDRINRLRDENNASKQIITAEEKKIKTNDAIIKKLQTIDGQRDALNRSQNELKNLQEEKRASIESTSGSESVQNKEAEREEKVFQNFAAIMIAILITILIIIGIFGFIIITR